MSSPNSLRSSCRAIGRNRLARSGAGPAKDRDVIQFTIDVAEDLSGKFVPTFVKPEHTQPERSAFYITEGRLFPAGTIQGDDADFRRSSLKRRLSVPTRGAEASPPSQNPSSGTQDDSGRIAARVKEG